MINKKIIIIIFLIILLLLNNNNIENYDTCNALIQSECSPNALATGNNINNNSCLCLELVSSISYSNGIYTVIFNYTFDNDVYLFSITDTTTNLSVMSTPILLTPSPDLPSTYTFSWSQTILKTTLYIFIFNCNNYTTNIPFYISITPTNEPSLLLTCKICLILYVHIPVYLLQMDRVYVHIYLQILLLHLHLKYLQ